MATGEPPTVTFSLTEEDLFRLLMFHSLHQQRRLTWSGYLAAIAFTFVMVAKEGQLGMAVGFAVALAIILIPTYRWSLRRAARRMMRDSQQLVGENTRVLSPEGVLETGAWGEATLNWNAFDRIVDASATPRKPPRRRLVTQTDFTKGSHTSCSAGKLQNQTGQTAPLNGPAIIQPAFPGTILPTMANSTPPIAPKTAPAHTPTRRPPTSPKSEKSPPIAPRIAPVAAP
jgi:hypothetical protein